MCQYTERCPVRRHKPTTKCQYAPDGRTRSNASRLAPPRQRTPSLPSTTFRPAVQPERPKREAPPKLEAPPLPRPRAVHRKKNRQKLIDGATDAAIEACVAYLFEPDGIYEVVADRLLAKTKMRRRFGRKRNHRLCLVLNQAAHICDTGTYIDLAAQGVEQGLRIAYDMPKPVAKTLAECAAAGAKRLLPLTVFGPANFPVFLRCLIALVCPSLERCPCQSDVCTTLLGPLAANGLRTVVEGSSSEAQSPPASR
jgi:hypothetical protein